MAALDSAAGDSAPGSRDTANAKVMIRVENLRKVYGGNPKPAVDGISFDVRAGEVLGFVGPNGAGKTTTMKILTSFLAPTGGRAEVAGFDTYADSVRSRTPRRASRCATSTASSWPATGGRRRAT